MSTDREMTDRGTGASPPCSPTREVACSPIKFRSAIEASTSDDSEDDSMLNQQTKMRKDHTKVMNKMNSSQLIAPLPSSSSNTSNNSTPVLASSSPINPIPLMSIGFNNRYGSYSTNRSSTFKNNINKNWNKTREWPVDPPGRYHFKHHQRRKRLNHQHQLHYQHSHHGHQCHCLSCISRPPTTTSGNDV
ncbi:unnamed protein product [Adineta steineri]|uniref:Uncharacterized protein n=1 Tax=Adineta steineri TaxID=433720 RepID=A0A815ZIW5_9BILA|nr:unnamed protein product [Adineta steineri]CAF1675221.1 unnamed protein product [Adineta steineri]